MNTHKAATWTAQDGTWERFHIVGENGETLCGKQVPGNAEIEETHIAHCGQCEAIARAAKIDNAKVGDGITMCIGSDSEAYTIIKRTAKTLYVTEDHAKLINAEELKFHPGGFAAHCSNVGDQRYEYTPNPDGYVYKVTRRIAKYADGEERPYWVRAGVPVKAGYGRASFGRCKIYDYNF